MDDTQHGTRPDLDAGDRGVGPLVAWLVSLVVAIVAFTAMGGGALAAPPVTDPAAWGDWAADRDAVVATVAVLRLVVLAMAWYLVGVTTIGAVGRVARWARLVQVADALSVPMVRRVLQASLGVGLATTVVASSSGVMVPTTTGPTTAAVAAQTALDAPQMRPVLPGASGDAPQMRPIDLPAAAGPSMTPLSTSAEADLAPPGMRPLPPDPAPTVTATDDPAADAAPAEVPDTVTVAEGDHLWAIAERHVTAVRGASATDDEVGDYWRRLVDANLGRLVDPDDPDLVLPGQRFVLPDLEPGEPA